jgi:DNA-binding transcriptional LysR family regulator
LRSGGPAAIVGIGTEEDAAVELRHLRYFMAVAKAGSFVKAARALNLAQPSLSRQIQDLERELGVSLFERLPHGVRLTRAGHRFQPDARRLLDGADRAAARLKPRGHSPHASLHVGYGELLAHWRSVSEIFLGFRVAHPDIPLRAIEMGKSDIQSALRDDRIDVAVIGVVQWPVRGFDAERLFSAAQTGVLLAAGHALAARERIRIADLAPLTWYHLPSEATWDAYKQVRQELRDRGFVAGHRATRPGSFAFLPLIAAGDGWALADVALGNTVASLTDGIVYRPFEDPPMDIWVTAVWRKGERNERVMKLLDVARRLSPIVDGAGEAASAMRP